MSTDTRTLYVTIGGKRRAVTVGGPSNLMAEARAYAGMARDDRENLLRDLTPAPAFHAPSPIGSRFD